MTALPVRPDDDYFDALRRVDPAAASDHVLGLLDEGVPLATIVTDVLAPAQVRVGEMWEAGAWGVADEHAATAVTETALISLVAAAPPAPSRTRAPHVALACAEGEWHTQPARMAGAIAQAAGARVTLLGPSLPAAQLGRRLRAGDVDVLALSCTLPTNLLGAALCIREAHAAGVPVVAGGGAFAGRAARALAIGADAFAVSADALAGPVPALLGRSVDVPTEVFVLDGADRCTLDDVYEQLVALHPGLTALSAEQQTRTREDLQWMARFAAAAVLTGDRDVLDDFLAWTRRVLDAQVTPAVLATGAAVLAEAFDPVAPVGARLLRAAAAGPVPERDGPPHRGP
jgi:methanogenic corrinoid protein MtbC1